MPRTKVDRVRLTIQLPADLHAALHHKSIEQDKPMVQVLKDALRTYLANGKPQNR